MEKVYGNFKLKNAQKANALYCAGTALGPIHKNSRLVSFRRGFISPVYQESPLNLPQKKPKTQYFCKNLSKNPLFFRGEDRF